MANKLFLCVLALLGLQLALAAPEVVQSGYLYPNAVEELMAKLKEMQPMVAMQATEEGNFTACWKATYGRGVGTIPSSCPNSERNGLLCYPYCSEGYYGVGPVCWKHCDEGFTDIGALCSKNAHIITSDNSGCPWYDKCGLTFAKGCSRCPDGYHNDGCFCRIDAKVYAKPTYGRGVGFPLECDAGQVKDAGLCYPACGDHYNGVGPVCWHTCPPEFPHETGAICCDSGKTCNSKVANMAMAVLTAIASAVAAGEDPAQILPAIKKSIEAVMGFVLPICWE